LFLEHRRFLAGIRDPSEGFETAIRQSKPGVVQLLLDSRLMDDTGNRERFSAVFRRCCRVKSWECPSECLLIAARHPAIDVAANESEALINCCQSNRTAIAAVLLDDPRIDPGTNGNLSLAYAVIHSTAPDFALLRLFEQHSRVDPRLQNGEVLRVCFKRTDCPAIKFLRLLCDDRFTDLPDGLWPDQLVAADNKISTTRIDPSNARKFALLACYANCRRVAGASHRCALIFAQTFYHRLFVPRDLSPAQPRSWKQFNRNVDLLLEIYTDWVVFIQRAVRAKLYRPLSGSMFQRTAEHFHRLSLH
jgi:hypothetical protein